MDIIVTNKDNSELEVSAVDLGFSDHLAQVVKIYTGKGNRSDKIFLRRQLTNNNIEESKNLLSNTTTYVLYKYCGRNGTEKY